MDERAADNHSRTTLAAVFLDRDGVLIADRGILTSADEIDLVPGVPEALRKLKAAGFRLVVVSNQAVVARGLLTEAQLQAIHDVLARRLAVAGGPAPDAVYYCPHHPQATLDAYRVVCDCRKPRPGMLLRAAREHQLDLAASFMVGDRNTDVLAGAAAGCRTVLVRTAMTDAPSIVTVDPIDPRHMQVDNLNVPPIRPDYACADLSAAADWIVRAPRGYPVVWVGGRR